MAVLRTLTTTEASTNCIDGDMTQPFYIVEKGRQVGVYIDAATLNSLIEAAAEVMGDFRLVEETPNETTRQAFAETDAGDTVGSATEEEFFKELRSG